MSGESLADGIEEAPGQGRCERESQSKDTYASIHIEFLVERGRGEEPVTLGVAGLVDDVVLELVAEFL